jgi:hypothetical protein
MKRVILVAVCVLTLLAGSAYRATASDTDDKFTNQTLNDKYGFHVLALSLDPTFTTGRSIPFAISGYYEFHGDGTLNGKDTVSTQGVIIPRQYTGTYHVNPDGTGTLKLNISPTFQPVGNFVIVESGREIEIIFAVPGNLNAFTLRKQHTAD